MKWRYHSMISHLVDLYSIFCKVYYTVRHKNPIAVLVASKRKYFVSITARIHIVIVHHTTGCLVFLTHTLISCTFTCIYPKVHCLIKSLIVSLGTNKSFTNIDDSDPVDLIYALP